jgi:hypothetical protein
VSPIETGNLAAPSGRAILKSIAVFLPGVIVLALIIAVLIFLIRKAERPPRYP